MKINWRIKHDEVEQERNVLVGMILHAWGKLRSGDEKGAESILKDALDFQANPTHKERGER